MSDNDGGSIEAQIKADKDTKGDARSSRLTLRKNNEEVLRRVLQTEARKKCNDAIKNFADCAKTNGMMVVLQCRKLNKDSKSHR